MEKKFSKSHLKNNLEKKNEKIKKVYFILENYENNNSKINNYGDDEDDDYEDDIKNII